MILHVLCFPRIAPESHDGPFSAIADARQRLIERNGLSAEEADKRINSQLSNDERTNHADVVISTDCSLDEVTNRVNEVWGALQERIAGDG